MKTLHFPIMSLVAIGSMASFNSCDEHEPFDNSIHVGHVLLADHRTMSMEDYETQSGAKAVGVVFAAQSGNHPTLAVLLDQPSPDCFAEQLGIAQGTSCSLEAHDGFTNTVSLQAGTYSETESRWDAEDSAMVQYTNMRDLSPLGQQALRSHEFGQSDYIPSVAEMRLLVASLPTINPIIERLGGTPISTMPDGGQCWFWTSTEVKENPENMAWLMSAVNGGIQQTPKDESHPFRLVVALNY